MMTNDQFRSKYGPWALVTGASYGIGQQFCLQLAAAGLNIILVARNQDPLGDLAKKLTNQFKVETAVFAVDLESSEGVTTLLRQLKDLDIGMIVNNAGISLLGNFESQNIVDLDRQVKLNCLAPLHITHELIRRMLTRKSGGVIFMSSTAGMQGVPYLSVYSATKAFVLNFGESLYYELKSHGVDALTVCPGTTQTPGWNKTIGGDFNPSGSPMLTPEEVVRHALANIGKRPSIVVGILFRLLAFLERHVFGKRVWLYFTFGTMKRTMLKIQRFHSKAR